MSEALLKKLVELAERQAADLADIRAVLVRGERDARPLLSKRAAARVLGVGRSTTLAEMIERKEIKTVKSHGQEMVPQSEIDRLRREGPRAAPARDRRSKKYVPGSIRALKF